MKDLAHIDLVTQAIDYIEHNLTEPLSVSEICKVSPVTSWQFQRIFRAYVHDSIGNYIRGRRLAKAAEEILANNALDGRLIDIAVKFQFSSHEAFTRAFKDEFGILPRDIRGRPDFRLIHARPRVDRMKINLIQTGISKEPKIAPFGSRKFLGLQTIIESPLGIEAESNKIVSNHWENFDKIRKQIKNGKKGISYGLSMSPTQSLNEESLTYLAAVEVNDFYDAPDWCQSFELPETLFAAFEVKGFKECCNVTTDYIYGFWMPTSSYRRGTGPDFEIFDHSIYRRDDANSISYYFVPILPK